MRDERPAPGRDASSAGGARHGPGGAARHPRRVGRASPGPARDERGMPQQSGPVRLVCHAESRYADGGVWLVVRQDGNHLEFEREDAPGSGRSRGRSSGALLGTFATACRSAPGQLSMACRYRVGSRPWSDADRRAGARDRDRPAPGDHLVARQAAEHPLTASRVDARLAALMPANPPGRSRQRRENVTVNWQVSGAEEPDRVQAPAMPVQTSCASPAAGRET